MPGLTIETFDPNDPTDDEAFTAWHAAVAGCQRAEFGDRETAFSMEELRAQHRVTSRRCERLLAREGGRQVGAALLVLPLRDNLSTAFGEVHVLPAHRGRGVGSALLADLERRARGAGRVRLCPESGRAVDRPDLATSFWTRRGYSPALPTLRSDLDLADGAASVDAALATVEAEIADHAGEDYRLLRWSDGIPDAWVEQRAVLAGRMSTDAPMDDLPLEPEVWDADRLSEVFRLARRQGRRVVETAALHVPSGRLAGYTNAAVAAHTPHVAYQWDTLVLKEHRGHRLGMRLKAANLRYLLDEVPTVRRVVTWNATSNAPMLRVNRAMGFEVRGYFTEWHKEL